MCSHSDHIVELSTIFFVAVGRSQLDYTTLILHFRFDTSTCHQFENIGSRYRKSLHRNGCIKMQNYIVRHLTEYILYFTYKGADCVIAYIYLLFFPLSLFKWEKDSLVRVSLVQANTTYILTALA